MVGKTGIEKWRELDGDNTLALDWPLTEDSHVWEIGGFEGRWAQQIWDKFHCHITIFEPQLWAVEKMQKRFNGNIKIDIRPYGLWTSNTSLSIGNYYTDGASVVNVVKETQTGSFVDFNKEIRNFTAPINLCLMNIEGGEFNLIPAMWFSGKMEMFEIFWCQFHPTLVDNGEKRAAYIFKFMEQTHEMLWNCHPVAVAWRKK